MKLSRDTWIAIGLLASLLILTVLAAAGERDEEAAILLDSRSSGPTGARALRLWLDEIGYLVGDEIGDSYEIPPQANGALILEPLWYLAISNDDFEAIDDWVSSGGTLLVASRGAAAGRIAAHYDFEIRTLPATEAAVAAAAPILEQPAASRAAVNTNIFLSTERTDYLTLLNASQGPVMVAFEQGRGRVILSAVVEPFTNVGLKEPGNAELVLNLFSSLPAGSSIWFDEWHHGRLPAPDLEDSWEGPGSWLRSTPGGHAVLFAALAIFAWLGIGGRPFGPARAEQGLAQRRTPLEYVTAIANLNRRAGNRRALLFHYRQQVKRKLGRRYRVDPGLPDAEFIELLARYNSQLNTNSLGALLANLQQADVTEKEMIRLAREAAGWLKQPN